MLLEHLLWIEDTAAHENYSVVYVTTLKVTVRCRINYVLSLLTRLLLPPFVLLRTMLGLVTAGCAGLWS